VPTPSPAVVEALQIRRWALGTLAGHPSTPPTASPKAWALFLGRESCALRLRIAAGDQAPPSLRAAADADAQLILLLRAELTDVLTVAVGAGVRPIILKGGAALLDPLRAVRAKDIDLLLADGGARTMIAALDSAGWQSLGGGSGHHFAERCRPGRPPVEVHTSEGGESVGLGAGAERRAVDHPTLSSARLLAPADRVRQLVIHQTIQHVGYRGRLRDLLLLSDALLPGDDPDPALWGLGGGELDSARGVLQMAGALRDHTPPKERFEELAALWYSMDLSASGVEVSPIRRTMANWAFDFAVGGDAVGYRWRYSWGARLEDRSWFDGFKPLEPFPRLHRAARGVARLVWLPPIVLGAWIVARRELGRARAAVASLRE
jgi:putative nucleotidyltransferase-like protein